MHGNMLHDMPAHGPGDAGALRYLQGADIEKLRLRHLRDMPYALNKRYSDRTAHPWSPPIKRSRMNTWRRSQPREWWRLTW